MCLNFSPIESLYTSFDVGFVTVFDALHITHYTLHIIHYTLHIIHYTLYITHYTLYIIDILVKSHLLLSMWRYVINSICLSLLMPL